MSYGVLVGCDFRHKRLNARANPGINHHFVQAERGTFIIADLADQAMMSDRQ
jgi:hypothetical protein